MCRVQREDPALATVVAIQSNLQRPPSVIGRYRSLKTVRQVWYFWLIAKNGLGACSVRVGPGCIAQDSRRKDRVQRLLTSSYFPFNLAFYLSGVRLFMTDTSVPFKKL